MRTWTGRHGLIGLVLGVVLGSWLSVSVGAQNFIWGSINGVPFASGVLLGDGTASAPSLAFASDTDTGLYNYATNVIGFAAAGSVRLSVSAATPISMTPSSLTGSAATSALVLNQTWNTTGAPKAFLMTITDTASDPASLAMQILGDTTGTKNLFSVSKLGNLSAGAPAITVGTGTGVTVNDTASVRRVVYKVTVASTQFVAAATTADITIATLPAKTRLVGVYADLATPFACASTCTSATLSMTLGTSAGGNQILVSFDADAAAAVFGDADVELGASINAAGRVQDAYLPSWSATQIVTARLTSGTGNIGTGAATNLSAGSITFYLITEVLP